MDIPHTMMVKIKWAISSEASWAQPTADKKTFLPLRFSHESNPRSQENGDEVLVPQLAFLSDVPINTRLCPVLVHIYYGLQNMSIT